ncbi:FmdB family transcriptional regulator [Oleiharenicola sp. Vm1]|uniref:FmdB family transcriptional regulator n=1 Tax=Oleiharenicola sp. Vm1 TaxID=3398393 RepID=UPI0039F4828E
MPIYEYYSPDTHKIYSFFAKTLAQGKRTPRCPDDPQARMVKMVSGFAIGGARQEETAAPAPAASGDAAEDARMEAAMGAMEREFSNVDENDPRAMARLMRRMAELSGEKLDEPMEEAVRKLEEGADPDALEAQMGEGFGPEPGADASLGGDPLAGAGKPPEPREGRARFKRRRPPPVRDPKLYDYD